QLLKDQFHVGVLGVSDAQRVLAQLADLPLVGEALESLVDRARGREVVLLRDGLDTVSPGDTEVDVDGLLHHGDIRLLEPHEFAPGPARGHSSVPRRAEIDATRPVAAHSSSRSTILTAASGSTKFW